MNFDIFSPRYEHNDSDGIFGHGEHEESQWRSKRQHQTPKKLG